MVRPRLQFSASLGRSLQLLCLAAVAFGCATPPAAPPDPGAAAAAYLAVGRVDDAAREIELAVRANPNRTDLRMQAAEIQEEAGNNERAIGHLEAALRLAPSNTEVWLALGGLETRRENTADAYVAFRRATELAPDDLRGVRGLALAADQLGFQEEAESAYARWAELEKLASEGEPAASR